MITPQREAGSTKLVEDRSALQFGAGTQNTRRMTAAEGKLGMKGASQSKANIHDIIKREINSKQAQQQYLHHMHRIMSNQHSPTKGLSE